LAPRIVERYRQDRRFCRYRQVGILFCSGAESAELQQNGTIRARITKQGNKPARTALVECSRVAKKCSPYLQKFYQPIPHSRGGGKPNTALARKFLGVIYHTLKNNWVFEDFPNFVLAS
jgi:transposase IS116/IS110/IS902 family protein